MIRIESIPIDPSTQYIFFFFSPSNFTGFSFVSFAVIVSPAEFELMKNAAVIVLVTKSLEMTSNL